MIILVEKGFAELRSLRRENEESFYIYNFFRIFKKSSGKIVRKLRKLRTIFLFQNSKEIEICFKYPINHF